MGLLDDLEPKAKVWPCKVRDVAATLEPSDGKILLAAVESEDWSVTGLSTALRKKGISVSDVPIKSHRTKACSCYRT